MFISNRKRGEWNAAQYLFNRTFSGVSTSGVRKRSPRAVDVANKSTMPIVLVNDVDQIDRLKVRRNQPTASRIPIVSTATSIACPVLPGTNV